MHEEELLDYTATEALSIDPHSIRAGIIIQLPPKEELNTPDTLRALDRTLFEIFYLNPEVALFLFKLAQLITTHEKLIVRSELMTIYGEYNEIEHLLELRVIYQKLLEFSQLDWDTKEIKNHLRN